MGGPPRFLRCSGGMPGRMLLTRVLSSRTRPGSGTRPRCTGPPLLCTLEHSNNTLAWKPTPQRPRPCGRRTPCLSSTTAVGSSTTAARTWLWAWHMPTWRSTSNFCWSSLSVDGKGPVCARRRSSTVCISGNGWRVGAGWRGRVGLNARGGHGRAARCAMHQKSATNKPARASLCSRKDRCSPDQGSMLPHCQDCSRVGAR